MLCLAVLTAFAAAGARAEDPPKTEEPPKAEASGQVKQADKLAEEFGVTREEVAALRGKGMGWGEVRHALSLSQKTGKPVGDIVKMRESGMGWGEIAKKEGVKLGPDRAGKSTEPKGERGMSGERGAGRGPGERGPKERGRGRVK